MPSKDRGKAKECAADLFRKHRQDQEASLEELCVPEMNKPAEKIIDGTAQGDSKQSGGFE
jgi:hypothetical protein